MHFAQRYELSLQVQQDQAIQMSLCGNTHSMIAFKDMKITNPKTDSTSTNNNSSTYLHMCKYAYVQYL